MIHIEETREPKERASEPSMRVHTPKPRTHSRYVLPSNRHHFSVHFDILRRFVTGTRGGVEGVTADRVEGEVVPVQAASMNVRFLRDIGLLTPTERGRYKPTPEAIRFVNARSLSDDRARPVLSALLSSRWFADVARSVFATQPIMTEDQFIGELALVAETDREKEEPALRVILGYLVYAGLVTRDERGLSLGTSPSPRAETVGQALGQFETPVPSTEPRVTAPEKAVTEAPGWHILQTEDFYVKIRSDLAAVEDLVEHLATLKKKILRLQSRREESYPTPEQVRETQARVRGD